MGAFAASMGRRVVIALAAVSSVAAVWVATAEPASAHGRCRSSEERVSELTASARVRCATARRVAIAYDTAVMRSGSFPGGRVAAARYTCRTTSVGAAEQESFAVLCTTRGGVVRFAWGV